MTAGTGDQDPRPTWRELLTRAAGSLGQGADSGSGGDAWRLLERASGLEGAELMLALDASATRKSVAHLEEMVRRRQRGEPLQYVVGRWCFRSLDLLVDPRVLIPRPETEQVVEVAIAELHRAGAHEREVRVVDLGTGSGAIALAIAAEVPRATVWGTDRSPEALAVARANLAGLGRPAARVRLVEGHWFAALPAALRGAVDLVVTNPPYIADGEELPEEVAAWEPAEALRAGPDGTEAIAAVTEEAPAWLVPGGSLVVEIAPHQAEAACRLAERAGLAAVAAHPDLAGLARTLVARRP